MLQIQYYAKGFLGITSALVILSGIAYSAFILSNIIFNPIYSLIFASFVAICALLLCIRAIKYACTDTPAQQQLSGDAAKQEGQSSEEKSAPATAMSAINNIIDKRIFGNRSKKTNAVISLVIGAAVGVICTFLASHLIPLSPLAIFGIITAVVSPAWFLTSYNASKYNNFQQSAAFVAATERNNN